jgi:inosose dehydratase
MSNAASSGSSILDRLAAAPISWGVCEVPGWGLQLPPDRVLSEMRSLGVLATEAGPDGYLGRDSALVRALLDRYGLELVGGFLPVVLHDPARLGASLTSARRAAALLGALGASVLCSALVLDHEWSAPRPLSTEEWQHLLAALPLLDGIAAEHGLEHALHPHWGTLVEFEPEVMRIVEESDVALCLDTGHLTLGGTNPATLAAEASGRIVHAHLKDVDTGVAERLRAGGLTLLQAVQAGLFRPLGDGQARVRDAVLGLERAGYRGWYVLEQDVALAAEPPKGAGPVEDVERSIEFLRTFERGEATAAAGTGREATGGQQGSDTTRATIPSHDKEEHE